VSSHNGEQPAEGARSGLQEPPDLAPPTESLEAVTEGAPEGAPTLDGPPADSASSGIRAQASGLLESFEPQKALGLALGAGVVIALLLRWLRSRGAGEA
jgi:hypothetical protein